MPPSVPPRRRARGRSALLGGALTLSLAALAFPAQTATARPSASLPAAAAAAATDPVSAAQAAAEKSGSPVTIPSLDNATETTRANPDGSFTLTATAEPTRVLSGGHWVDIDTTLRRNQNGTVSPVATGSDLVLSGGGSGALASMTTAGKHLTIGWPTSLPQPALSGATATYADVLPGVDLTVTATPSGGFSDVLIVKNAAAAANPALEKLQFSAKATGLSFTTDAAGNITATGSDGTPAFVSPPPSMWDSSTDATADGEATPGTTGTSAVRGPGVHARTGRIAAHISGDALTLVPDRTLLTASTTTYPVYLDPSWSPSGKTGFAEVQSGCPSALTYDDTTYEPNGEGVGDNSFSGCVGTERTYYQFTLSKIFGTHIIGATMKTSETYSASCSASADVSAYLASSAIGSGTDWNNKPTLASTALDTEPVGDACSSNPSTGFTVTSAVTTKAATGNGTLTIGLRGDESDGTDFKRFSTKPTLVVSYDSVPKVASAYTSPASSCDATGTPPFTVIGNTAITLKAEQTDADTGATLKASFTYSKYGGAQLGSYTETGTVGSGGSQGWNIGTLASGNYTWTVKTTDGTETSSTSTCHFTVDATAPKPPTITSSAFPSTDQGTANPDRHSGGLDDFSFGPSGATDVASYAYAWNTMPPTVSPQQTVAAVAGNNPTPVTLTPPGLGLNKLNVYSVDSSGNVSTTAEEDFYTLGSGTTVPVDGDFNDDGSPDVITVGTSSDPGLWLYQGGTDASGKFNGTASAPIQEGGAGTVNGTGSAKDWNGALITHGEFTGDPGSEQDLFARTANGAATIYAGEGDSGDGSNFDPANGEDVSVAMSDGSTPDWSKDQQIVAAGQLQQDYTGAWIYPNSSGGIGPDLWAVQGDALGYYAATYTTGIYAPFTVISATGWKNKTIVDAGDVDDLPALWVRDNTTGELDLWTSDDPDIAAGATGSTETVLATSGFATSNYTMLASADDTGPGGCPQLWGLSATTKQLTFIPCTQVAHNWPLTDGGTTAADSADAQGDGLDAAVSGGATWVQDPTRGTVLSLDGSTGYAATSGPAVETSKSFTVSAWVKLNSLAANSTVVSQSDGTETQVDGFELYYSSAAKAWAFNRCDQDLDGGGFDHVYGGTPAVGVWTHLVGVYDADQGQLALYVNGALAGTTPYTGVSWNASGPVEIGRRLKTTYGAYADAAISDVSVYNTDLPAGSTADTAAAVGATADTAVHTWRLGDATGTSAADAPGTGTSPLNATLNGAATWAKDATRGTVLGLNGTTGYAATGGPAVDTSKSFTVSAWVKLNSLAANSTFVSQSDSTSVGAANGFQLYYSTTAKEWGFDRSNGDTTTSSFTPVYGGTPTVGAWTQLTGVYDAGDGTMSLYVNGSLAASGLYGGSSWNATGPVQIGRRLYQGSYGEYANAAISDVRLWNTALPPAGLATLVPEGALAQID